MRVDLIEQVVVLDTYPAAGSYAGTADEVDRLATDATVTTQHVPPARQ